MTIPESQPTNPEKWAAGDQEARIALFGAFNPSIFVPEWFVDQHLLDPEEIEDVPTEPELPIVIGFQLQWCVVEVTLDRFLIYSREREPERILDLTDRWMELLPHTPISGLAVSWELQLTAPTESQFHAALDQLCPVPPPLAQVHGDITTRRSNIVSTLGSESLRFRTLISPSNEVDNVLEASVILEQLLSQAGERSAGAGLARGSLKEAWCLAQAKTDDLRLALREMTDDD